MGEFLSVPLTNQHSVSANNYYNNYDGKVISEISSSVSQYNLK